MQLVKNDKEISNLDVKRISENKWQISGESVAKIKAAYDNCKIARKAAEKLQKDAHASLWQTINSITGTSNKDSLSIDTDYMSDGIVFLKRDEDKINSIGDLLRHLVEE